MKQLLILIFCFCSLSLISQDFVLEIEGGFSAIGNQDTSSVVIGSYGFGAYYEQSISEYFTASLGAKIISKGGGSETLFGTISIKLNYIEVPLIFRGNIPFKNVLFHPEFGFYWSQGLLVSAKLDDMDIDEYSFSESGFLKPDSGLYFGLGFSKEDILVMGRLSTGLKDIHIEEENDWNNAVISLSLRVPIKKLIKNKS